MRHLIGIFLSFIIVTANATVMCLRNNSYFAVLSVSRDGISSSTDGKIWTVTFDYNTSSLNAQTAKGYAACNEQSGTQYQADASISTTTRDTGTNCWCSMKLPLVSDWVFVNTYSSDAQCASGCATTCANAVQTSVTMRTNMFESVW